MWWKYLAAAGLLIVMFMSLRTPLSPGILSVHDNEISDKESVIAIIGYNTHFESGADMQVWLDYNGRSRCALQLTVLDETHVLAEFDTKQSLPNNLLDVYVNNSTDGTILALESVRSYNIAIDSTATASKCYAAVSVNDHGHYSIPFRVTLWETIRNLNFHVPMWFAMFFIMGLSTVQSAFFLAKNKLDHDDRASAAVRVGLIFAFAGLATGSLWAKFTWGTWWSGERQLNGAAITTLIYLAYLVLRNSIEDKDKKARIAAVYNIAAFAMLIIFIFVLPRIGTKIELHPGKQGNPAFSNYDLDNKLRMLFWPAVLCWIIVGYWIYSLRYRLLSLNRKQDEKWDNASIAFDKDS